MKLHLCALLGLVPVLSVDAAQVCTTTSDVRDLGPGSNVDGRPYELALTGFPHPGQTLTVRLAGAGPSVSGLLYYSFTEAELFLPMFDATLRIAAPQVLDDLAAGPGGADDDAFSFVVPPNLCGVEVFLQGAVVDADATGGLAVTRGLGVRFGAPSSTPFPPGPGFGVFDSYAVNEDLSDLVVGDFDADGHVDVVVPQSAASSIGFLKGDGAGGFEQPIYTAIPWPAQRLAAADLDGDGLLDLAATLFLNDAVAVLHGLGDGTFLPLATRPVGVGPMEVKLADVDDDGDLDLLTVARLSGELAVVFSGGDGTFGAPLRSFLGLNAHALELGDLDGDQDLDLVVVNEETCRVMLGDGAGAFVSAGEISQSIRLPHLVDFDGDGDLDLSLEGSIRTFYYLNDGAGSFTATIGETIPGSNGRAYGDIGFGPGLERIRGHDTFLALDEWTGTRFEPRLTIATGGGSPWLGGPCLDPFGCGYVDPWFHYGEARLVDLDQDGTRDLVWARFLGGGREIRTHRGVPGGTFDGTSVFDVEEFFQQPELLDMNGDGYLDLVGIQGWAVRWARGDGRGFFDDPTVSAATLSTAYDWDHGDVDGDGNLDFVLANRSANGVGVLLGSPLGDAFTLSQTVSTTGGPLALDLADANGDGLLDLAVGMQIPELVAVHLGNGDGTFQAAAWESALSSTFQLTLAFVDLDDDGVQDLVMKGAGASLDTWSGVGDGTFQNPSSIGLAFTPYFLEVGDVDGVGALDLVVSGGTSGHLVLLAQQGGPHVVGSSGSEGGALSLVDVTGDGDLDLVFDQSRMLLRGRGDGTFDAPYEYGPLGASLVGDVTGDGAPDLIRVVPDWTSEVSTTRSRLYD